MMRALASLAALAAVAGGAWAFAQSDVFDPAAIAERERQQLLSAKRQSAQAMARSAQFEEQAQQARSEADRLKKRSAALAAVIGHEGFVLVAVLVQQLTDQEDTGNNPWRQVFDQEGNLLPGVADLGEVELNPAPGWWPSGATPRSPATRSPV